MKWLDNYQKVKQLRDALVWLPVWERDKRAFVPEVWHHVELIVITRIELSFEKTGILTLLSIFSGGTWPSAAPNV